jgi:hypothetical protein
MFDLDQFVADCRTAIAQDPSHKFVHEVVARAVSNPAAVLKGIGEPKRAAILPRAGFFRISRSGTAAPMCAMRCANCRPCLIKGGLHAKSESADDLSRGDR